MKTLELRRYSRLWDQDDIYEALKDDKGSECIRSIVTELSTFFTRKLALSPYSFAKMCNLQFLVIRSTHNSDREFISCHNILPEGLESLPNEIRYLRWEYYPLQSLPEKFSAEQLVILDLSDSKVEKLWNGVQNLKNLKEVTLFSCKFLKELPDFSKAINLEVLDLRCCSQMSSVHSSVFSLNKLVKYPFICVHSSVFSLSKLVFSSLTELISNIHLRSLSYLNLSWCSSLREFSVTSENMIELNLERTKVEKLPSSFGRQGKLEILRLERSRIRMLPPSTKNLTRLR